MQMTSPPALRALGLSDVLIQEALRLERPELRLVRVIEPQRSQARVDDGERIFDAPLYPSFLGELKAQGDALAVGDWAGLDAEGKLRLRLPRRGQLNRADMDGRPQVLAAHVDVAVLVMGLDRDWSPNRLQRYLMLARSGGVMPIVVLTKADRCADPAARIADIQALVGPQVPVHALDARSEAAARLLGRYAESGRTLVLLGSSGVGKSTLTNALAGSAQRTRATRDFDDRGRHTTTARSLHRLPGGACLIDTPGMRELRLTGEESVLDAGFDDIAALAAQCRFADCRHEQEPGCAVRDAVSPPRLAHYHKLLAELAQTRSDALSKQRQRASARVQRRGLRKFCKDRES